MLYIGSKLYPIIKATSRSEPVFDIYKSVGDWELGKMSKDRAFMVCETSKTAALCALVSARTSIGLHIVCVCNMVHFELGNTKEVSFYHIYVTVVEYSIRAWLYIGSWEISVQAYLRCAYVKYKRTMYIRIHRLHVKRLRMLVCPG